jgi:hypothetical protein
MFQFASRHVHQKVFPISRLHMGLLVERGQFDAGTLESRQSRRVGEVNHEQPDTKGWDSWS